VKKITEEDILFFLEHATITKEFNAQKLEKLTRKEREFEVEFFCDYSLKKEFISKDE
jgi:hypothetical protein